MSVIIKYSWINWLGILQIWLILGRSIQKTELDCSKQLHAVERSLNFLWRKSLTFLARKNSQDTPLMPWQAWETLWMAWRQEMRAAPGGFAAPLWHGAQGQMRGVGPRLAPLPQNWVWVSPHSPHSTALVTAQHLCLCSQHISGAATAASDLPWGLCITFCFWLQARAWNSCAAGLCNLCTTGRKNKSNSLSGRHLPGDSGTNTRNKI